MFYHCFAGLARFREVLWEMVGGACGSSLVVLLSPQPVRPAHPRELWDWRSREDPLEPVSVPAPFLDYRLSVHPKRSQILWQGKSWLVSGGSTVMSISACNSLHIWESETHKQHELDTVQFGDDLCTQTQQG